MVSEPHEWTVPAPLRALLWWPPLAFLLVLLEPTAAALSIAATGAALAVLGAVGTTVSRMIARRRTAPGDGLAPPAIADRPVPMAVEGAPAGLRRFAFDLDGWRSSSGPPERYHVDPHVRARNSLDQVATDPHPHPDASSLLVPIT